MQLASRGLERIGQYDKKDFQIFVDEDNGQKYFKLVKGGETKNHKTDSEDVMGKGGRIYFNTNSAGLNQGQYLEDFMKKLNPAGKKLFQRPKRTSKDFKLEVNPDVW